MSDAFSQQNDPTPYINSIPGMAKAPLPETTKPVTRDELTQQDEDIRSQEMQAIERGRQKREALEKVHPGVPADPKLENIGKPKAMDFTDPMKAFQNPAVLIATLGSLFSRQPMTAALNAGAAAMTAYHKGEAEEFAKKREEWKDATEAAIKQNQVELEKYNAAWKKSDRAVANKLAEMQAIAAGTKDEIMIAAIASGRVERLDKLLDAREKASLELEKSTRQFENQKEIARIRAGGESGVQDVVNGIISGEQPPTLQGLYRMGAPVREGLAHAHFDLAKAQLEWARSQKQVQALNGPQMTRFFGLAKSVDRTIDEVRELSQKMKLSGMPALNRGELMILMQTKGNSPEGQLATRYLTAVNTLKEEFANLAQGGYAPTESAWALANQQVNGDYGVNQLDASLTEIKRLVNYRLQALPGAAEVGPNAANRYTGGGSATPAATVPKTDDGWGEVKVH